MNQIDVVLKGRYCCSQQQDRLAGLFRPGRGITDESA